MAASYPKELRQRILKAYDQGFGTSHIARVFSVSESWARRVKQRYRERGEVEARPMGGARRCKIDRQQLAKLVEEQPDATLDELRQRIDVECSRSGIDKALRALDLTFKKRRFTLRSRTGLTL